MHLRAWARSMMKVFGHEMTERYSVCQVMGSGLRNTEVFRVSSVVVGMVIVRAASTC